MIRRVGFWLAALLTVSSAAVLGLVAGCVLLYGLLSLVHELRH